MNIVKRKTLKHIKQVVTSKASSDIDSERSSVSMDRSSSFDNSRRSRYGSSMSILAQNSASMANLQPQTPGSQG